MACRYAVATPLTYENLTLSVSRAWNVDNISSYFSTSPVRPSRVEQVKANAFISSLGTAGATEYVPWVTGCLI